MINTPLFTNNSRIYLMIIGIIISCNSIALVDNFNYFGESHGLSSLGVRSITHDNIGFLWVGTTNGVYKFNGYEFKKTNIISESKNLIINKIYADRHDNIWVGTSSNGLFRYQKNRWEKIELLSSYYENKTPSIISILEKDNKIWIATNGGLSFINLNNNKLIHIETFKGKHIGSLEFINDNELLVGTKGQLINYSLKFEKAKSYNLSIYENAIIHDTLNYLDKIWIATSEGLLFFDTPTKQFSLGPKELQNTRVLNVLKEQDNIWVASVEKGLFYFEKGKKMRIISYSKNLNSLSDKYLRTIHISNNDLWVGNFFNGLNHLNLDTLDFNYETTQENSLYCAETAITYTILLKSDTQVWLSTSDGLIQFNKLTGECKLINDSKTPYVIYSVAENKNGIWLSTSQGLKQFDEQNQQIINLEFNGVVYFTFLDKNGKDYLATNAGLYEFDVSTKSAHLVVNTNNIEIKNHKIDSNGKIYLLTSQGLSYLENDQIKYLDIKDVERNSPSISSFQINANNDLYIGTDDQRLIQYSNDGLLIESFSLNNEIIKGFTVNSILIEVNENIVWLGTNKGLIRYDLISKHINVFKNVAGNSTNLYLPNAIYKSKDHDMYFGTTNGFVYFNYYDIVLNETAPTVVINNMKLLNKDVKVGYQYPSGFLLDNEINNLDEIVVNHLDYIIGFEFAALDYANPSAIKYRYRLKGLEKDWVPVDANHRQVTYSNLFPGNYTFEVKALNSYGIWNEKAKSIKIKVLPAPWFTWWAFTIYACTIIYLLYWYLQIKNRENRRMTNLLRVQVKERTSELEVQKQTVVDLLARKNEMFANVSHEFRTPLTLILGPINKLLNSRLHSEDIQSLKMVNRNANRLLTMIEQLLLLAKISGEEKIQHIPQLINHQILSIIEIFQPLAHEKNIQLRLINNNKATINAVPNTIDTVLGNLISNAIKYTPTGGEISVNSFTKDNQIIIEVKDTGCGLDDQQKINIFNRFERLESHANIDGVGLGLSVVEEMLKINKGSIEIESELGNGSVFRVKFNTIENAISEPIANDKYRLVTQLAKNARLELTNKQTMVKSVGQKSNDTILIIEDNNDMRLHIANCLKNHFHCLLADRGKSGIALAIKYVPDIIICDVMMPEMDGFKVSRILRSDSRTSHIPLILLTALHNKESRIKGWREHVDCYLTKPFDAQELLLQLHNVLVIRNILKKKAGALIIAGQNTVTNTYLPKKDQEFVNKLNALIAKKYTNANYQRTQLASDMAMSVKQLQRKLKALIDKNPMELLREYRLQKAAEMLKDGFQVSITCDDCGFNSLSHFSQCFKAHYGISPKNYQQTCDSKS